MKTIDWNEREYLFFERFDCNLTAEYENDWREWHILREIISNALDSVGGDPAKVSLITLDGFITIADQGSGYPVVYAKRIGASSKKVDTGSIGQFGEGLKMAALTCLRKGLSIRFASQNWLIVPALVTVEEGIQVLVFDIYETESSISGSAVSIQATPEVEQIIDRLGVYFLQFSSVEPLSGSMLSGIYPAGNEPTVYNKGVRIKLIEAMFSYGASMEELNRDRDLVHDDILCRAIRDIWEQVENPEIIKAYFLESHRAGLDGNACSYIEFRHSIFPQNREAWRSEFTLLFGDKAVLCTNDLASREALCLGYDPVKLEYYGRQAAEYIGIQKDTDVCRADYEFSWSDHLTLHEEDRLSFFQKIADLMDMECPKMKVFDSYAKSEYISGVYNHAKDEIYLKRAILSEDLCTGLNTFIHELIHRHTGADDYTREFAHGLSTLAAKLALRLTQDAGMPVTLKLTERGFQMPATFAYSAETLDAIIAMGGSSIVIETGPYRLKARLDGKRLQPFSTMRSVTFHKGKFHINIPASIRQMLPEEVVFHVAGTAQLGA